MVLATFMVFIHTKLASSKFEIISKISRNKCQKAVFRRHSSNMVTQETKIRGDKVEIRKEHIVICEITYF